MREGIHPNYREVLFVDLSNGVDQRTQMSQHDRSGAEVAAELEHAFGFENDA